MINKLEKEFLKESNAIEGVYDKDSLKQAEKAWERIKSIKGDLAITDILEVHQILLENLNPRIAGKFRNCAVKIGWRIKKQEPEAVLANKVFNILNMINAAKKPVSKKEAAIEASKASRRLATKTAHILFEDIHPFEDGNGRVGRILYNIHNIRLGLPIHVIHEGPEQWQYYEWFH